MPQQKHLVKVRKVDMKPDMFIRSVGSHLFKGNTFFKTNQNLRKLGSWKPNVPYGPDGRMAAACLPDGVFPLLFPDGAPIWISNPSDQNWTKSDQNYAKSAKVNMLRFGDVNFDFGFER